MLGNGLPNVKVQRITLMNSQVDTGLTVDVDFSITIRTKFSNTTKGHIYGPKDFYDNIKILVVQMKNSDNITEKMQASAASLGKAVLVKKRFSKEDYNVYTVKNSRIKKQSDNSEMYFSTPVNFETRSGNLNSLSYIFIPFMEMNDSSGYVFGTPTIEKVIVDGSTNTVATLLTKPSGEVYTGPVHRYKNSLMAGARHTSKPHSVLTERTVYNSTIHDLRVFDLMKKAKQVSRKAPLQQNNVYFSEFFISRDEENNCRFLFFLDFKNLLKNASDLSWLYNSPAAAADIVRASRIDSIKILRRRKPNSSINSFAMPIARQNTDSDSRIIANSRDSRSGTFVDRSFIETKGEDIMHLGNIREIKMQTNSANNRVFSGTDVEVNQIGKGIYQYGIEVTINEASVPFLKIKRNELSLTLGKIEKYWNLSGKKGTFNHRIKHFTPSFKKKVRRDTIYYAIEKYAEIANMVHRQDSIFGSIEKTTTTLYNLVCPINGTPTNIKRLLELMSVLLMRVDEQLGRSHNSVPNKNYRLDGVAPQRLKNTQKTVTYKKMKWFDTYFDASLPKNTGYYFIRPSKKTKNGHVMITGADYSSLINAQTNKLFGNSLSIDVSKNITLDLTRTQNTYLSPIQIGLGRDNTTDLIDKGAGFYDIDRYNNILAEIIKFNSDDTMLQNRAKDNKDLSTHETLQNNLIDIFASFGCTVENIPRFSTDTTAPGSVDLISIVDRDPSSKITPVDSKVLARQQQTTTEGTQVNSNNILNRIASSLFNEEAPSPEHYNIYDARDERFGYSSSSDSLGSLPNQIKALIALYSDAPIGIKIDDLSGDHRDQFGFLHTNFLNLMRVDVLTGFSGGNLSKATFSPLFANNLKNGLNLCRLVRYTSNTKGVPSMKVDYPVFYEYFILDNKGQNRLFNKSLSSESQSKKLKTRTPQPKIDAAKKLEDFKKMASVMTSAKNLQTNLYIPPKPAQSPRTQRSAQLDTPPPVSRSDRRSSAQTARQATQPSRSPTSSPGMGNQGGGY